MHARRTARVGWARILAGIAALIGLNAGVLAPVSAHAASAPAISSITPRFGPLTGGLFGNAHGTITIVGTGFAGTNAVMFGSTAARAWSVKSSTLIAVMPPPDSNNEGVVVTVTTRTGGTSSVNCAFIDSGCADVFFYLSTTSYSSQSLSLDSLNNGNNSVTVSAGSEGSPSSTAHECGYTTAPSGGTSLTASLTYSVPTSGTTLSGNLNLYQAWNTIPSAFLGNATVKLNHPVSVTISLNGAAGDCIEIPALSFYGLFGLDVVLEPNISATLSYTFTIEPGSYGLNGGWIPGGVGLETPKVTIDCPGQHSCVNGSPLAGSVQATLVGGVMLRLGPEIGSGGSQAGAYVEAGAGIGLGVGTGSNGSYAEVCAGAIWDAHVNLSIAGFGVNLGAGGPIGRPVQLVGTGNGYPSEQCPLGSISSAPPHVTSMSPLRGPAAGGTSVTIKGSGFGYDSTVSFGSSPATNVSVSLLGNQITATSPRGKGIVAVTVGDDAGKSVSPARYTYVSATGPDTVSVAASPTSLVAGSGATSTVTATVLDANGNPVNGDSVDFSFEWDGSCGSLSSLSAPTDSSGNASMTYTAASTQGDCTIMATESVTDSDATTQIAQTAPLVNGDWPTFGYDASGARYNPNETLLGPPTEQNLTERWSSTTGGAIATSPAIANGIAYIDSGNRSGEDYLEAFDAATGTLLWSYRTDSDDYPDYSSPTVANGIVYVGSNNGTLYALNAVTGNLVWSYQLLGQINSSPVVSNGVLYISGGVGWDTYAVVALDAATGNLLQTYEIGDNEINSSPAIVNGVIYVSEAGGHLYALDATTGDLLWSYQASGSGGVVTSPVVTNGTVYFGAQDGMYGDDYLYALNAVNGSLLWSYQGIPTDYGNGATTPAAVANGVVYVVCGYFSYDNLCALDAATGNLLWSYQAAETFFRSVPVVANGVVYDSTIYGDLYALNTTTGSRIGYCFAANTYYTQSPAVANGMVYVASQNGYLDACGLPNIVTVNASPASLPAGGSQTSTVTATVNDPSGNPVSGDTVTFSFASDGSCGSLSASSATTDNSGNASVTYSAATMSGACTVIATESTTHGSGTVQIITTSQ